MLTNLAWGVYIHWTRFKQLAAQVCRNTGVSPRDSLAAVYDELIGHELFHCHTEIFSTIGEDLREDSLYLPYLKHYRKVWGTQQCIEEALATSYGLAHVRNKAVRQELERVADNLPDGYKQWKNYPYSPTGFFHFGYWWKGIEELTEQITGDASCASWELSAHFLPRRILSGVPRHIWFQGKTVPSDGLTYLVEHKDFIGALRQLFPGFHIELTNTKRGKHPFKLFINGKSIPYKPTWDGVPPVIFRQVAEAVGMKGNELRQARLSRLVWRVERPDRSFILR